MTNEAYCEKIYDILSEGRFVQWEEISDLFVEILQQKLIDNNMSIIYIFYNSNSSLTDLYYIDRYFRNYKIENYRKINIDEIPINEFLNIVNDSNSRCFTMVKWPNSKFGKIKLYFNKKYRLHRRYKENHVISWYGLPFRRVQGDIFFEWISGNKDKIPYIIESLSDETSKQTFVEIVRANVQNDVYMLDQNSMTQKYFEYYKPLDDEVWVNCGAATGDTILHYLNLRKDRFKRIYAFEGG